MGRPLPPAGKDRAARKTADHLGIVKQKQPGLNYVGLAVPVGRITDAQLFDLARLADDYGSGDVRLTTSQNVIVPNVPDEQAGAPRRRAAAAASFRPTRPASIRGLVSCTGIDYCHFALIETKELAVKTARHLEREPAGEQASDDALVGLPGRLRQSRRGRHRPARQEHPDQRRDGRGGGRVRRRQVRAEREGRHEDARGCAVRTSCRRCSSG